MMAVQLDTVVGDQTTETVAIHQSSFLIGRAGDCHLRTQDPFVSRHHCQLRVERGQVYVVDLGSKNGTYVNNQRVEGRRALAPGDLLAVGMRVMRIQLADEQAGPSRS